MVTHRDADAGAIGLQAQLGRLRCAGAVAQCVVEQVAQQQAHAGRVQRQGGQARSSIEQDRGRVRMPALELGDDFARQLRQDYWLAVQRGVAGGEALAFKQVGDQAGHLLQVAQQRVALRRDLGGLGQQFGVEAGAGQRAAQLVADGQQQRALGIEHLADVLSHGVDGAGELAELIGPGGAPYRDRLAEVTQAEAPRACADGIQWPQKVAQVQEGQQREHQQGHQGVADQMGLALEGLFVDADADPVAVGGAARQQALPLLVAAPALPVLADIVRGSVRRCLLAGARRVRAPLHLRALDGDGQGQALRDGAGAFHAGRAAGRDLVDQAVDIVHQQRPGRFSPALRKGALCPADEGEGHGQREQQEHQQQAQLDRMAQRIAQPAVPERGAFCSPLGRVDLAHRVVLRSASAYPALRRVLMQSSGSSFLRRRLTTMSTARV